MADLAAIGAVWSAMNSLLSASGAVVHDLRIV
jgi:hypothetical protein